jgi:asparagine synthase (glutamine-hydrolysing)
MCGIAGIFSQSPDKHPVGRIGQVTNAMSHRGPDADGFFEEGTVSLGHRRLSIIDLSDSANCPFIDHSGRYVLVFNGEMYNFQDVRRELPDYPFKTSGDTEVLMAAFVKWGPDCIRRFKGMFAFAVWDRQEQVLTVCRDRMGVKPIYYYQDEQVFIFASEIRAIMASGLVPAKLDWQAIMEFFSYQSVGYPASPIEHIRQLEAGSYLTIRRGQTNKTVYWQLGNQDAQTDFSDPDAVKRQIRQLLRDAVQRRLISDVPIGAFLSGGIDSSTVVGLMAEVSDKPPVTFNISFDEKEFDESPYAEMIAKKFNTRHSRIQLKPESFLDELENALGAMDSPSADGINTYVVSKAIRQAGITVALSGVGGDELFAGYPFFARYLQMQRYRGLYGLTGPLRSLAAGVLRATGSGRNHRMARMLSAPDVSIASLYPEFRRILSPELLGKLTSLNTRQATLLEQELGRHAEVFNHLPLLSQVSAAEYIGYTQHTLLKDTDQMSMAVSLEVREPFFDHELVEYMLQVPDTIKRPVYPKSLLVESVRPLLPDAVVHRRKQGFLFPWELWMKRELQSFCTERIARLSQRDFIHGPALRAYWKRFLQGDPSVRWTEAWLFVVLEYWMEKNHVES